MYKKLQLFLWILFLIALITPVVSHAEISKYPIFKGTWSVIGDGLYQPNQRTIVNYEGTVAVPTTYKPKFSYGVGISKDNLRLEYFFKYIDKPRFLVAYDFFPSAIGTPYIGYVYGRGTEKAGDGTTNLVLKSRSDVLVGMTFQPLPFVNVYGEYLLADNMFFAGVRFKLGFTVK